MEELRLSAKDKQDARMALLSYYSSERIAHSVYLLALTIAFLSFVEFTPHILKVTSIVFPTFSERLVTVVILSLMASVFIVLVVYILGRTIVWNYLRLAILGVKPKDGSGVAYDPERTTLTFLLQLHEGCLDYVKKKHGVWARFYGLKGRYLVFVWVDLFVVFLVVSLLLLLFL